MSEKSPYLSSSPELEAIRSVRKVQEYEPKDALKQDRRTPGQIDRDRLLYASNFARLAEITQTVSADHGYVFHNRLTHSLKVAQIARRIAEKLIGEDRELVNSVGGLDADCAEAAGLAHDLGHPPFGHIAEEELHKAIRRIVKVDTSGNPVIENDKPVLECPDGFEGNAQSFRIVTQFATGDPREYVKRSSGRETYRLMDGLNLTRATLNGILKYPWFFSESDAKKSRKWGSYGSEESFFNWVRNEFDGPNFRFEDGVKSLEAEVMDWADDITYAVHDVVDFYCAGKIPLELLTVQGSVDSQELQNFFENTFANNIKRKNGEIRLFGDILESEDELKKRIEDYMEAFREVLLQFNTYVTGRYAGAASQRQLVWQLMTEFIRPYVNAIRVKKSSDCVVDIDPVCKDQIAMLKQLTWHYVILDVELATVQQGQRRVVRKLFKRLFGIADGAHEFPKALKVFPKYYEDAIKAEVSKNKDEIERANVIRLVTDYISSRTEKEVVNVYQKLFGSRIGADS